LMLVATLGHTIGHRIMGLHVVRLDHNRMVGIWRALLRAVLVCLVIPAGVWDADGRGLHDRLSGTAIIRFYAGKSPTTQSFAIRAGFHRVHSFWYRQLLSAQGREATDDLLHLCLRNCWFESLYLAGNLWQRNLPFFIAAFQRCHWNSGEKALHASFF